MNKKVSQNKMVAEISELCLGQKRVFKLENKSSIVVIQEETTLDELGKKVMLIINKNDVENEIRPFLDSYVETVAERHLPIIEGQMCCCKVDGSNNFISVYEIYDSERNKFLIVMEIDDVKNVLIYSDMKVIIF